MGHVARAGDGNLKSQGPDSRGLINGISFVLLGVDCRVWVLPVGLSKAGWNTTAQRGEYVSGAIKLLLFAGDGLAVMGAHFRGIVAISLEVVAEPGILEGNSVLEKCEHINSVLYLQQFIPG